MASQRQEKLGRLIQRDLSDIFQKHGQELFHGAFVTVTIVRMTPDLGLAKVYLSILAHPEGQKLVDELNEKHLTHLRYELSKKLKNQMRKMPELRFYLDDTSEEASKIDQLIDSLDIPPAEDED